MNPKLTYVAIALYACAFALLFCTWAYIVIQKVPSADTLVNYIIGALGMLAGHVFTILQGGTTNVTTVDGITPKQPQGGFARIGLLTTLAFVAAFAAGLSGCTTTTASLYRGYATDAKAGIQTWDDNAIATIHDVFCAQPYSAIQRHPEIQPGLIALCGGMANATSLDPNQVQLMLNIAKQLGYPVPTTQGVVPGPAASMPMIGK